VVEGVEASSMDVFADLVLQANRVLAF